MSPVKPNNLGYQAPKRKNPYEDAIKRRMAAKQTAIKEDNTLAASDSQSDEIAQKRKKVGY